MIPTPLNTSRPAQNIGKATRLLYNDLYQPGDSEFYQTLFGFIQSHPNMFDGFIIKHGNRISGFSIWDQTTSDTTNLIANLVDINSGGLYEYQLVMACRLLNEKGIRFLNRGESERKGLDDFKQKFSLVKSLHLYSGLVDNTPIMRISFIPQIQKPIIDQSPVFA